MTIVCNGTKHEVENLSLSFSRLGYGQLMIATAVNGRFVPVAAARFGCLKRHDSSRSTSLAGG